MNTHLLYVPLPLRGVATTVKVVNTGCMSSALLATYVVLRDLTIYLVRSFIFRRHADQVTGLDVSFLLREIIGGHTVNRYQELVQSVIITKKNRLLSHDPSLQLVGTGRSAFAFRIENSNTVIKIFFPSCEYIAREEAEIYTLLEGIHYFPRIHEAGLNYVVMDYIEGDTLFDCITHGKAVTTDHIKEIDHALALASETGLNPSDIHLRNIFITSADEIKLIDVARYRQMKDCPQWSNLKKAHRQFYRKHFFLKKIPSSFLNAVAFLYKRGLIPSYRV